LASHLFIQLRDLLIQIAEVYVQPLQQCAEPYRQLMLGQNARQTFYDRPPKRQADAELQQEAMELIDCLVRSRTSDSLMRCSTERKCATIGVLDWHQCDAHPHVADSSNLKGS
jgi:hypothetical protein